MSPSKAIRGLALAILLGLAPAQVAPAFAQAEAVSCQGDLAIFPLESGEALRFRVEIADTEAARARGLMFRRDLPRGTGMLFIYESPRRVSFWMRNTLIPLDLIFMDAAGVIRHIHHNAIPLDETPIPGAAVGDPDPARLMVLEIAGGEARALGLRVGQAMAHPRLDQEIAKAPCG